MRLCIAVALGALCLYFASPRLAQAQSAQFVSRFVWSEKARAFGGISGFELAPGGGAFRAISDRGTLLSGVLRREGGKITGVENLRMVQLRGALGGPLRGAMQDAEGLVWDGGDEVIVSFEGNHRLAAFDADGMVRRPYPIVREFLGFASNGGLEALARGPDGALYALPEFVGRDGKITVYRYLNGRWSVATRIEGDAQFLPVGADFGPDGALYLLERDFTGLGFRSRVRRFDMSDPARAGAGEILLQSRARQFDNLEGLSVWRDGAGRMRLTMVSDDNFMAFQRSEIVEFVIDTGLAKRDAKD